MSTKYAYLCQHSKRSWSVIVYWLMRTCVIALKKSALRALLYLGSITLSSLRRYWHGLYLKNNTSFPDVIYWYLPFLRFNNAINTIDYFFELLILAIKVVVARTDVWRIIYSYSSQVTWVFRSNRSWSCFIADTLSYS